MDFAFLARCAFKFEQTNKDIIIQSCTSFLAFAACISYFCASKYKAYDHSKQCIA